jgi:hypothetical protein
MYPVHSYTIERGATMVVFPYEAVEQLLKLTHARTKKHRRRSVMDKETEEVSLGWVVTKEEAMDQ